MRRDGCGENRGNGEPRHEDRQPLGEAGDEGIAAAEPGELCVGRTNGGELCVRLRP